MGEQHEGAQAGRDHRAFLDATLPHLDTVYRVARHASSDPSSAEDLVQETYLRAYAAFATHDGDRTRAWLVTICLNLARSSWRQRARRPPTELTDRLEEREAASPRRTSKLARDPVEEVTERLERAAVSAALARLPEPQRMAIVLMDLAGYSAAEVAGTLGCPRGTVLARAHRGRRRLARLLEEQGFHRDML